MKQQYFNNAEIAVFGEGIIDLIPDGCGGYSPLVGGSPYNVARALGIQQLPVAYLSPLSSDKMGDFLKQQIRKDNVLFDEGLVVNQPTSLALVNLNENGIPTYSLYREGIADRSYSVEQVINSLPRNLKIFHTGSLAIVPEDLDKVLEIIKENKKRQVLISIDLNVRANVVEDHESYIKGLRSLVPYCDILKASDEDLRFIGINDWRAEAEDLLSTMQGGLVAITAGDKGAWIGSLNCQVELPAYTLSELEDTIGAGDCFHAGLISAVYAHKLFEREKLTHCSKDILKEILTWASASAAINVSRKGCKPPSISEIKDFIA